MVGVRTRELRVMFRASSLALSSLSETRHCLRTRMRIQACAFYRAACCCCKHSALFQAGLQAEAFSEGWINYVHFLAFN